MSSRALSVHSALLYVGKVWIMGLAAAVLVPLALLAAVLDAFGRNEQLVPRVLAASARLEALVDVHGDLTHIEVREDVASARTTGA